MEYENVWTKNRNIDKSNTEPKERKIPWATSFGHILKTKPKQKALVPQAMVTFRRPPTLGNLLTNYKNIAMDRNKNYNNIAKSSGCGRCGLCGNFGSLLNMVKNTNITTTSKGTTIKLKQHLTCRSYGIYSAQCLICKEIYIGQTCTTFAKRWNLHRQDWKKMTNLESGKYEITDNNDDKVLFFHYVQFHKTIIAKKPDL